MPTRPRGWRADGDGLSAVDSRMEGSLRLVCAPRSRSLKAPGVCSHATARKRHERCPGIGVPTPVTTGTTPATAHGARVEAGGVDVLRGRGLAVGAYAMTSAFLRPACGLRQTQTAARPYRTGAIGGYISARCRPCSFPPRARCGLLGATLTRRPTRSAALHSVCGQNSWGLELVASSGCW
jgi:hypothetical protein